MTDPQAEWRALMLAALAGDAGAYHKLLAVLAPPIRAFVVRRLPNDRASVEDIVQETLLAIHRFRDRYDPAQPLAPWVYAIARYKLVDHCRRAKRGGVAVSLDGVEEFLIQAEPEELAAGHDIAALIAKLPPNQSTAIRLVKLEDMSVRDAAAKSGMSESAIKVNIHRGIKKLAALVARAETS
jgi:RNA polymerase sigma-70 factor (ECF subfamily)